MKSQKKRNYTEEDIDLARLSKALGHPARIKILRLLASLNNCSFNDISGKLPLARSTVSQHLTALKDKGLIKGIYDPPKAEYSINKKNWKKSRAMIDAFLNIKIVRK